MENCKIIFRQAISSDLDAVCTLYRVASENPYSVWNEEYPTRQEAEHDLETGNLFVLTDTNTLVGAASIVPESEMDAMDIWHFSNGNHREVARIAISPLWQGKGYAAKMVRSVLEVLRQRGYTSVRLSAACCNLPACRTYQKLGFQIRGEADLYGSHYYLMEKEL